MFRASQHPSSGVLKTVTATSGIGREFKILSISRLIVKQIVPLSCFRYEVTDPTNCSTSLLILCDIL